MNNNIFNSISFQIIDIDEQDKWTRWIMKYTLIIQSFFSTKILLKLWKIASSTG